MNNTRNAITALLGEYKKAMLELANVISHLTTDELTAVADEYTLNPECKSIQAVLTHVVSSGYSYCVYIRNHRNIDTKRPERNFRLSADEYIDDLNELLEFTQQTFERIYDKDLEETDTAKKIATKWGQGYDIEQLMEHAIVHILRHRRQITNFKRLVSDK